MRILRLVRAAVVAAAIAAPLGAPPPSPMKRLELAVDWHISLILTGTQMPPSCQGPKSTVISTV